MSPTIISHLFHFVKRFSKSFFRIFVIFFEALCSAEAFQSDSIIISQLFPFVKRFLKSFFNFFRDLFGTVELSTGFCFAPLAQCLHIIALLSSIVKGFFQSFSSLVFSALCYNIGAFLLYTMNNFSPISVGFRPFFKKKRRKPLCRETPSEPVQNRSYRLITSTPERKA